QRKGHWHGPVYQSLHCRVAWRPTLGHRELRTRSDFSVHAASHVLSRARMMAEAAGTVFIVDDDPHVRGAIQRMLKSAGLRSESFGTAQEFMRRMPSDGPSCLILDVRLSGASGLDLQRELKKAGIEIPIVFLTGHGDIPMTVRAMKLGAVEF